MSLLTYKVFHILGIALALVALGGATQRALDGGGGSRKLIGITHGAAFLIILVSGFGALAKIGMGFPPWVLLKIAILILIGLLPFLIRKMPGQAAVLWFAIPALVGFAAYLALYKPF